MAKLLIGHVIICGYGTLGEKVVDVLAGHNINFVIIELDPKKVERAKAYSLKDGVSILSNFPKVKFDESVELHFNLNVDLKSSDQAVRGTVLLSHGSGKKIRVIAFCKGGRR